MHLSDCGQDPKRHNEILFSSLAQAAPSLQLASTTTVFCARIRRSGTLRPRNLGRPQYPRGALST